MSLIIGFIISIIFNQLLEMFIQKRAELLARGLDIPVYQKLLFITVMAGLPVAIIIFYIWPGT